MLPEQRKSQRKVIKSRAKVALDGNQTIEGRTLDIGTDGLSVGFADPVQAGQGAYVRFDVMLDGKANPVTARAKAVYCIFSQGQFKVGFQFVNLDAASSTVINRFLR